ncbi:hypothetical protein NDU88_004134 [Pleurodeles waltl]|uniref:Uncharacterized protein n=1 Tax=Pleurodeles waltl TaxID=8319 RepID=A0AAV7VJC7_PLEWA|nr:hypothetical protein NDU88_004134 [Pleurodeles waltl]
MFQHYRNVFFYSHEAVTKIRYLLAEAGYVCPNGGRGRGKAFQVKSWHAVVTCGSSALSPRRRLGRPICLAPCVRPTKESAPRTGQNAGFHFWGQTSWPFAAPCGILGSTAVIEPAVVGADTGRNSFAVLPTSGSELRSRWFLPPVLG